MSLFCTKQIGSNNVGKYKQSGSQSLNCLTVRTLVLNAILSVCHKLPSIMHFECLHAAGGLITMETIVIVIPTCKKAIKGNNHPDRGDV